MTFALKFQKFVDYTLGIPVAILCYTLMYFILGYRITNAKEFRKYVSDVLERDETPLLICSNHMTYLDSGMIFWAFSHPLLFWFQYRRMSWNTPAENYKAHLFFRIIVYLNKGIFIKRGGNKEQVLQIVNCARGLLEAGEWVTLFPEGTRSKSGVFQKERLKLGVGRIVAPMKKCRVICMYIRGDKQRFGSEYPPRHSKFKLQWELLEFQNPSQSPLERTQIVDIVTKIGDKIAAFERNYLNDNNFSGNSDTLH